MTNFLMRIINLPLSTLYFKTILRFANLILTNPNYCLNKKLVSD